MLRAGVMEGGSAAAERVPAPHKAARFHRCSATSTCTGWTGHGDAQQHGVLVRYCDDAVVMCDTREQAEAALARLTRPAGRARAGAQGGQDPHRAPGRGGSGV